MLTFFDPLFWLQFLYFFIAVFVAFYIPGSIFIRKISLSPLHSIVLSAILGIVLWAYQGYFLGMLGFRSGTYIYLLVFTVLWLKYAASNREHFFKVDLKKIVVDKVLVGIIVIGTSIQLLTEFATGFLTKSGLSFCCGAPDSLFHLALTNQLVKNFPPIEAGMAGVVVQNYHYFANLVVADLVRVFGLPFIHTHYSFMMVFMTILFGFTAVCFSQLIGGTRVYTRWLLFFLFFHGDILYLLLLIVGKGLNFNFGFLYNASDFWFSPPRVYATVVLFGSLSLLTIWLKKKSEYIWWLTILCIVSLIGFKIYIALAPLVGLTIYGIYFLYKRNFRLILPLILGLALACSIYFPINSNAGGIFYVGFWRFENFLTYEQLGLLRLELARIVYATDHKYLQVFLFDLLFMGTYFFFIFGTLLLGLFQTKSSLKHFPKSIHYFLMSGIFVSFILGSFFLQKVGIGNTSQFLMTSMIIGCVYAALSCYFWTKKIKGKVKYFLIILIVLFTSLRVLYEGHNYIKRLSGVNDFSIKSQELYALTFIKEKTEYDATIAVSPGFAQDNNCYYMSFMTNRQMFLCGSKILDDHGVNPKPRLDIVDKIFKTVEPGIVRELLGKNNIDYLYLKKDDSLALSSTPDFMKKVFSNQEITIYKINNDSK